MALAFFDVETWEAFFKKGNWDHASGMVFFMFLSLFLCMPSFLWVLMWSKWMTDGMMGGFTDDCECIMAYIL